MKLSDLLSGDKQPNNQAQTEPKPQTQPQPQQEESMPAQAGQGSAQGAMSEPSTPEEMQIKEQIVLAGVNILNKQAEQVLQMLGKSNPSKGLASATDLIVQTVSQQAGMEIPLNIQVYGGVEVMQEILTYAQSAGIEISEEMFGKAAQYYVFDLMKKNNISPEQLEPMFEGTSEGEMKSMMEQQARYSMA